MPAGADPRLAPAHPHRRADVRLRPRPPDRRALPGRRLRVGRARGADLAGCVDAWPRLRWSSHPGRRMELQPRHRRPRPPRRGRLRAPSTPSSTRTILAPAGHDGDRLRRRRPVRHSPPCTPASAAGSGARADAFGAPPRSLRRGSPAAAGWCPRPPTTTASPSCCCAAASSTASASSDRARCAYLARNHLPGAPTWPRSVARCSPRCPSTASGSASGSSVVLDPARYRVPAAWRDGLGRRGQHGVLGRPRRGGHGPVLHPAHALERLSDPELAPPVWSTRPSSTRLPGRPDGPS